MNSQKTKRASRKARALALVKQGCSRKAVLRKVGISEYTLSDYLREEGLLGPSSDESRKLRDSRAAYAREQINTGHTPEDVAKEMKVSKATINGYLRRTGYFKKSTTREENKKKAIRLQGQGKTVSEIAQHLNLSSVTIIKYLTEDKVHEKAHCDKCSEAAKLERFRGENLCPACLNPDYKIGVRYAAHWKSLENSGAMSCF